LKKLIKKFFRLKSVDNFLREFLIPNLIFYYLFFVEKTSKKIIINQKYLDEIIEFNYTFSIWHGRQLLAVLHHKNKGIKVLVSPSRDGNAQDAFLKKCGFGSIRGSSDKNPVKSILKLIRTAKKEKCNFAFAVDGPKGPVYKVKPGIISFAKKTNYKIIPITTEIKYKLTFKSWDKTIFPLPFNKIFIIYNKHIEVNNNDNIKEKLLEVQYKMDELNLLCKKVLK